MLQSDDSHVNLQVGHAGGLPDAVPDDFEANEDFLKKAHHVLLEVS